MQDAGGENVEEHLEQLESQTEKMQRSMDNDRAHLEPR